MKVLARWCEEATLHVVALLQLDRVLEMVLSQDFILRTVWIGLITLTVALLVLMRTRWGQFQPLRKCLFLSVLAHLLMAGYATTVQIVANARPLTDEAVVSVSSINAVYDVSDSETEEQAASERPSRPWEQFATGDSPRPDGTPAQRQPTEDAGELVDRQMQQPLSELPEQATPDVELPEHDATTPQRGALSEAQAPAPEVAYDVATEIETVDAQRQDAAPLATPETLSDADRPEVTTSPLEVERPSPTSLPSQLLERPSSLPQLADVPRTERPTEVVPGPVDVFTPRAEQSPALPQPLEANPAQQPNEPAATDIAGNSLPRRRAPPTRSPSLLAPQLVPGESRLANNNALPSPSILEPAPLLDGQGTVPPLYRLRVAPDRAEQAQRRGATSETEAAVKRALQWLVAAQSADGRWDASRYGAGREQRIDGHDRGGAGADADTAMTGLALLAFLGAGHTHRTGPYQQVVADGLEFLRSQQAVDGSLAGEARNFARMYSHGIATLAVSEAYAMTSDSQLEPVVRRAVEYTLAAQHPTSGGWRYHPWRQQPSDRGDTSQLGWQLMALKSAELAGVAVPQSSRDGMVRFLNLVAAGNRGGLACYRPGERVSHPMTAEALACRQFLGMLRSNPASDEAGDYLLGSLPGSGRPNLYYWYYGTLGMYQLQGRHWLTWNDALQRTLLPLQRADGAWPAECVWGGYGGQVYSTALGALCLEVYYRYLPLYSDLVSGDIR